MMDDNKPIVDSDSRCASCHKFLINEDHVYRIQQRSVVNDARPGYPKTVQFGPYLLYCDDCGKIEKDRKIF